MKQYGLSRLKWFVSSTRTKLAALMIVMIALIIYFQWGANYVYDWASQTDRMAVQDLASRLEHVGEELAGYNKVVQRVDEADLLAANTYLNSQRGAIPSDVNINHIIRDILIIGDECGIQAVPLSTSEPSRLNAGGFEVLKWDINLIVEGEFESIATFAGRIDGNKVKGTIIKEVTIFPVSSDNTTGIRDSDATTAKGNFRISVFGWDSGASNVVQ